MNLSTFDMNFLFSAWAPWQRLLDTFKDYPRVHGTRTFLIWNPGPRRLQDSIATLPYRYDDRKKKWDLSVWTPDFKARFKAVIEAFAKANKYVVVSLVDYCCLSTRGWAEHPWNRKNNINGWGNDNLNALRSDASPETMSRLWHSIADNMLALIAPKYRPFVIFEVANEPRNSMLPIEAMCDYLLNAKKIPSERVWLSITPPQFPKLLAAENKNMRRAGCISLHSIGSVADVDAIYGNFPKGTVYKDCIIRPDSDGVNKPSGGPMTSGPHNLTALPPSRIRPIVKRYGQYAVMGFATDSSHSVPEWDDCFSHMKDILEVF